jgi:RNA methyltransferase, TrmH family
MITSVHNPKIQLIRQLIARRTEREAAGLCVVEGIRLCEEAWQNGWQPNLVLFSDEISARGSDLLRQMTEKGVEIEQAAHPLLKSLGDTETSQGLLALFTMKTVPLPVNADFIVAADGIRDPGNLGTLLRSASAAGVQVVILTNQSTDPFSPKVLRAGMGAQFRLPLITLDADQLVAYCKKQTPACSILAAVGQQGQSIWETDLRQPIALVVGSEADGVSPALIQSADLSVTIPMPGGSESLNAATAASILIFEVIRQRKPS